MKAIRIHDYGDAGALRFEEAPDPEIGPDEILIKVHAAAVNPIDWKIRNGAMRQMRPLAFPAILGSDLAGRVERVGALIIRFKLGDAVIASTGGAYAEYAVARTDAAAPAPESVPLAHAAGIPIAAGTAWTVLFDVVRLSPGASVLIHGASGGVGIFAVQLARLAGFHVVATTSGPNAALVRSLGAHQVIDYRAEDFAAKLKGIDLVVDTVGGDTQRRSFAVVKPGGSLVSIAAPPDEALAKEHGIAARFAVGNLAGTRLAEIAGLIDAGTLKLLIEKEFPLADAAAAQRLSETGRARGKIILKGLV